MASAQTEVMQRSPAKGRCPLGRGMVHLSYISSSTWHLDTSLPQADNELLHSQTMKLIVVLSVLLAVALARPQKPGDAVIVEASNDNDGLGTYKFGFRTSDGIVRQEQGQLKNAGTENEAIEVRGSFTYKDDQGVEHTVNFVADENGYQPQVAN